MPKIHLSDNYLIVQSKRGRAILSEINGLVRDASFWDDASSDIIAAKTVEILNRNPDDHLTVKGMDAKTHRGIEAHLINLFLYAVRNYFLFPKVNDAFSIIEKEKPKLFDVRLFSEYELRSYRDKMSTVRLEQDCGL